MKKKGNGFGIASLVLGILGFLTGFIAIGILFDIIAIVLGLIAIINKRQKSGLGIAGSILGFVGMITTIFIFSIFSDDDSAKTVITNEVVSEESESTETKDSILSTGQAFEKDGLKVTFDSKNEDYTGYNEYNTPKDGCKYVEATFTYNNVGESGDKYVSIYDCDCYADDTLCEQSYISEDDFVNANISPGRNVSFSVYYEVPTDAKSIELEYNSSSFWSTDSNVTFKIK